MTSNDPTPKTVEELVRVLMTLPGSSYERMAREHIVEFIAQKFCVAIMLVDQMPMAKKIMNDLYDELTKSDQQESRLLRHNVGILKLANILEAAGVNPPRPRVPTSDGSGRGEEP